MNKITLMQSCINWTEGNHASFDVKLDFDGQVFVDWGDGREHYVDVRGWQWERVEHRYDKIRWSEEEEVQITITSSEAQIVGFRSVSLDMQVHEVDCHEAASLVELDAPWTDILNINGCVALEHLDCGQFQGAELTLGELPKLKNFDCHSSHDLKKLNLTGCPALEKLNIEYTFALKSIALANNSVLKELTTDNYSRIKSNCWKFIESLLTKNKGKVILETYETISTIEYR